MPAATRNPRLINATILFIDLMNSVALSNSLTLWDYNKLINEYQDTLRTVLKELPSRYPIGEVNLGGDQLAVFFYNPAEAVEYSPEGVGGAQAEQPRSRRRVSPPAADSAPSAEQEQQQRSVSERDRALYGALRLAVSVKNAWISHERNMNRLDGDQPVLDVGIGINTGNVVLQERGDGQVRIEGFAINFAKRVQGFARHGRFCKIMLSKQAYEAFRVIKIQHAMLKQRAFFEDWTPSEGLLKGLAPGTQVFELKFFHVLEGFGIPPEQVATYERIFARDPVNIWAYSNLMNYYLYQQNNPGAALAIAEQALYCNPRNEKVFYDLAYLHAQIEQFDLARMYCQQCIQLNSQMDIAYDLLSDIELATGGSDEKILEYISKALVLTPGSASFQQSMAKALLKMGQKEAAAKHLRTARRLYPGIDSLDPEGTRLLEEGLGTVR